MRKGIWEIPEWCLYNIPKEHIIYCKDDYVPTQEQMRVNIIKMPSETAKAIRSAKNLPMPSPPVTVKVTAGKSLLNDPVKLENFDPTIPRPRKKPRSFA